MMFYHNCIESRTISVTVIIIIIIIIIRIIIMIMKLTNLFFKQGSQV